MNFEPEVGLGLTCVTVLVDASFSVSYFPMYLKLMYLKLSLSLILSCEIDYREKYSALNSKGFGFYPEPERVVVAE